MINLIPTAAKQNVIFEYWIRVGTVWLWLFITAMVVSILLLLPVYVLITTQISVYRDSANEAIEKMATFENVSLELAQATRQAQLIMSSDQQATLSELIYLFRSLEGQGVELSDVSMTRMATGIAPIAIAGLAVDRRSLSDFRDRLLASDRISTVDLPISNLARDRDIQFSMTVTLTNAPTP